MGFFRRARDLPGRFSQMDSILLLLLGVGLLWFVGAFNPQRFIGPIASGPSCTSLASPDTDNSRSLLAVTDDQQELELALRIPEQIGSDQTLQIDVLFHNPDRGPITLYLPENVTPGTLALGQVGAPVPTVSLRITSTTSGQVWSIYPRSPNLQPGSGLPQTYELDDLYLLLSDETCYIRYEFTYDELGTAGIVPGQYRVQAFYINTNNGVMPPPQFDPNTGLIPTAVFTNQGVWRSDVPLESDDSLLFNVLAAGATPAPAP